MIRAVMFDFGGVMTSSPFEAFARYERLHDLPDGFLRRINATDPDTNAWARLERGTVDLDTFAEAFEAEALALGHPVDGREVLGLLRGEVRPEMVAAVRSCAREFGTACLTNNFGSDDLPVHPDITRAFGLFDVVLESRLLGVRKPEEAFYQLACQALEVRPSDAVFLDDLGVNLKPARAMGMHTIKVTSSTEALSHLSELTGLPFDLFPNDPWGDGPDEPPPWEDIREPPPDNGW
jgi:putative hydrolase of the HAD superfamily